MNNINKISKKVFFIFLALSFQLSVKGFELNYIPSSLFSKDCKKENKEFIVKNVFDGDTISVETLRRSVSTSNLHNNNLKIRLLGIDAYEYDQPQGKVAKDFLTMLVLNKKVCIETDVQEKDKYERTLGYVFLKDVIASKAKQSHKPNNDSEIASSGLKPFLAMTSQANLFINEELLKSGQALLYNFPPNIKYKDRFKKAQIYGRQNMLGIWEEQDYIKETPYQHRHSKNKTKEKSK